MGILKSYFRKSEPKECKITPEEYYLPFYGVSGSISRISKKETGDYAVTRYNNIGEEVHYWDVSKKQLKKLLTNNFYPNLESYLQYNRAKYYQSLQESKKRKSVLGKNIHKLIRKENFFKWMTTLSVTLFVASLPLATVVMWTYASLIFAAFSITCLCAINDSIKEYRKLEFIKNYQQCAQILTDNKADSIKGKNSTLDPTKFIGLTQENLSEKIVGDDRKLIKSKQS